MEARERCPPQLTPTTSSFKPSPLSAATLRKVTPVPHLGSTAVLTLLMVARDEPTQENECGRSSPTPYLSCGGMNRGEMASPHPSPLYPRQVRMHALRA